MPSDPLNGLELTVEPNLGLEKSANLILSGKWQPCQVHDQLISTLINLLSSVAME